MNLLSWRRPLDHLDAPNVMNIQHLLHRNLAPLVVVGLTVFLVVAASLAHALRTNGVDPRVTMEQGGSSSFKRSAADAPSGIATAMDGEVAHTADRIGEATALALSAGLYAATEQLTKRTPPGARLLGCSGAAYSGAERASRLRALSAPETKVPSSPSTEAWRCVTAPRQ